MQRALSQGNLPDRGHRGAEEGSVDVFPEKFVKEKTETILWVAQRASAAVLAVCVAVHLATMIYAIRGGLSAAEILARTQGSVGWLAFYSVFVLAVAVHAPIGLRAVLIEWLGWRGPSRELALGAFALLLAAMGMRAVLGVFL
jgi:fumarate reductase subunit C